MLCRRHFSQFNSAVLLILSCACHAIGDPSCAVWHEVENEPCTRILPTSLPCDPLSDTAWYRCPTRWLPDCSPVLASDRPRQRIPSATEILALPKSKPALSPKPPEGTGEHTTSRGSNRNLTARTDDALRLPSLRSQPPATGSLAGLKRAVGDVHATSADPSRVSATREAAVAETDNR